MNHNLTQTTNSKIPTPKVLFQKFNLIKKMNIIKGIYSTCSTGVAT